MPAPNADNYAGNNVYLWQASGPLHASADIGDIAGLISDAIEMEENDLSILQISGLCSALTQWYDHRPAYLTMLYRCDQYSPNKARRGIVSNLSSSNTD